MPYSTADAASVPAAAAAAAATAAVIILGLCGSLHGAHLSVIVGRGQEALPQTLTACQLHTRPGSNTTAVSCKVLSGGTCTGFWAGGEQQCGFLWHMVLPRAALRLCQQVEPRGGPRHSCIKPCSMLLAAALSACSRSSGVLKGRGGTGLYAAGTALLPAAAAAVATCGCECAAHLQGRWSAGFPFTTVAT
jgi:hypothetical protein